MNLQVQQNRMIKLTHDQVTKGPNHNDIYPSCSYADGWYLETPGTFSQWNCDCGKQQQPLHMYTFVWQSVRKLEVFGSKVFRLQQKIFFNFAIEWCSTGIGKVIPCVFEHKNT